MFRDHGHAGLVWNQRTRAELQEALQARTLLHYRFISYPLEAGMSCADLTAEQLAPQLAVLTAPSSFLEALITACALNPGLFTSSKASSVPPGHLC